MVQNLPSEIFAPPRSSFNVPVAPPAASEEQVALCIPATWESVVRGALQQLIQPSTWQGTEAEIAAAQAEAATIIAMMTVGCASAGGEIPTPFWDDVTDTDDEATPEMQTWYGTVTNPTLPPGELTFVENAGIWLFTGFLALTGTPAAAILFHTLAPRFTLAMRGDDFAEVIRIILDGEEMARVETSGDPDALYEIPIVGDESVSPHELMIVRLS